MLAKNVKNLPTEAFARGIGKLHERIPSKNVVILGFDTEYDSVTQEIVSYQLSDGELSLNDTDPYTLSPTDLKCSRFLPATKDLSLAELSTWVRECLKDWGYNHRDINTILLVSHFSTAELSHIENFWEDGQVRRVSAAQVYNVSYRINDHQRLMVMDNYHFWNVGNGGNASLFAVAEKFGEKKLELPDDLPISKVTREYANDPRFRLYALWDAVLCARVFRKFRQRLWDEWQVDVLQYPTSASLAMAVYRQHFLSESIPCPDANVRRQAWLSLWGGRAEAYRAGDVLGAWTLRDVVSLYPISARLLHTLPTDKDWIERTEPISFQGLARVRFSFPDSVKFPCLPVCADGKLMFMSSGVSDCTLDEVRVALTLGATIEYLKVYEYDTGDTSLADFMQHFGKQKAECESKNEHGEMKDPVGRELSKLMQNSLIGKLSQNKGDVDIEQLKAFAAKEGLPLKLCLDPHFFHPSKPQAKPRIGGHIMPEWSALILGKARSIMALLLNNVGVSLICSIDSMLIPDEMNTRVDEEMAKIGVVLTNKNGGLVTSRVRVVRNRVYAAETTEGKLVFGASHAIHLGRTKRDCAACQAKLCMEPTHNATRFVLSDLTSYSKTKRLGLKTAIKTGRRFFGESEVEMDFSREWDNKRRLLPDGSTVPWRDTDEYETRFK